MTDTTIHIGFLARQLLAIAFLYALAWSLGVAIDRGGEILRVYELRGEIRLTEYE